MNDSKYDTICCKMFLFVDLQWIVLYWSKKSITYNNKYNEYNYNPAAIKFQCIFAWLLFTVYDSSDGDKYLLIQRIHVIIIRT